MRKKHLHAPSRAATPGAYLSSVGAYKNAFLAEHKKVKSWRVVAKPYGLKPNMARMIAYGYDPGNKIRAKLHLPAKQVVLACAKCGVAHVTKRCTNGNGKPRPPRIAIRLDNPDSAARSIMRNMGAGERDELIEILMERSDTVIA